ncbi:MAG TPA: hypothetical protein VFA07_09130 [Chthonomonadaceae bacterium]|nr:hypothetical protein [Chthonomonadaceae bacterium]
MKVYTTRKTSTWTPAKTVLVVIACFAAIIALVVYSRWQAANEMPKIVVPMPKMPAYNAFDYFQQAGYSVVDDQKIGDAISRQPRLAPSYTLADKEALVQENVDALKTLREGFAHPYVNPPLRSFKTLLPYYAKFRGLVRLLALEGQTKADRGDWSGAVNSWLDAVQMGEMIPHGSSLIGDLVGIACQAIGRARIWKAIDHLDAAQARQAARRLQAVMTHHLPFADVLQEEKWAGQAGLMEIFRQPNWPQELQHEMGMDNNAQNGNVSSALRLYLLFHGKGTILNNYTHYMDQGIANARQPYAAKSPPSPVPNDPIDQLLILDMDFSQARFKDAITETQNALLLVALALRAYYVEHGAYPQNLNQLVPAYLSRVSDDPFALNSPLSYRRTKTKYVLYSVGPDGKDDGGKPIDDPKRAREYSNNPNARYQVQKESLGDIVAGINTQ